MTQIYFKRINAATTLTSMAILGSDAVPLKKLAESFGFDTDRLTTVESSGKLANLDLSASTWTLDDLRGVFGHAAGEQNTPFVLAEKGIAL